MDIIFKDSFVVCDACVPFINSMLLGSTILRNLLPNMLINCSVCSTNRFSDPKYSTKAKHIVFIIQENLAKPENPETRSQSET